MIMRVVSLLFILSGCSTLGLGVQYKPVSYDPISVEKVNIKECFTINKYGILVYADLRINCPDYTEVKKEISFYLGYHFKKKDYFNNKAILFTGQPILSQVDCYKTYWRKDEKRFSKKTRLKVKKKFDECIEMKGNISVDGVAILPSLVVVFFNKAFGKNDGPSGTLHHEFCHMDLFKMYQFRDMKHEGSCYSIKLPWDKIHAKW